MYKRKRSNSDTIAFEPVTVVIQDGRPLAAEALRRNPPPDLVLSSDLTRRPHQPFPVSPSFVPTTLFISRPEPRRLCPLLSSPAFAVGGGSSSAVQMTPGSMLESSLASLASYEATGMHAGWQTGEGRENERLDRKRRRDEEDANDEARALGWSSSNPFVSTRLTASGVVEPRPSFQSNDSNDSFSHLGFQQPTPAIHVSVVVEDDQHLVAHPAAPDSRSIASAIFHPHLEPRLEYTRSTSYTPDLSFSASAFSSGGSAQLTQPTFSRTDHPSFVISHLDETKAANPDPAPHRPHPAAEGYFPFNGQALDGRSAGMDGRRSSIAGFESYGARPQADPPRAHWFEVEDSRGEQHQQQQQRLQASGGTRSSF